jgi:polysaccharide pyruvyl transferase WcaK-like protein
MAWNLKKMKPSYKIGAIGVSLGPFKTVEDEISVRNYLKSFDFLSLRDRYSFEYAMSLDLPFKPVEAFDLAALLPSIYKSEDILIQNGKITHKKVIGISICRYESFIKCGNIENEERRNGVLLEIIKKIDRSRKDISFKFFIINGNKVNGDSEITQWFLKNANLENSYEIIPYSPNTRKIYNSIAKCDLVVSVRLHAAIFACFAKIPFVLIEYHRKCADFLQDVGYGESKRFYDLNIELEESVKILNSYLDDRSSFKIPFMLEEQINKSMLNFTSINL